MSNEQNKTYCLLQDSGQEETLFLDEILAASDITKSAENEELLREYVKAQEAGDRNALHSKRFMRFWQWKRSPEIPWEGKPNGMLTWGTAIPNMYCPTCDSHIDRFYGITRTTVHNVKFPKQFHQSVDRIIFNRAERADDDYRAIMELARDLEDYYLARGVSIALRPGDTLGVPVWDSPLYWDKYSVYGIFFPTDTYGEPGFIFDEDAFDSFNRAFDLSNVFQTRVKVKSRFCDDVDKRFYCVTTSGRLHTAAIEENAALEICPRCGFKTLRTDKSDELTRDREIQENIRNSRLRKQRKTASCDLFDAPFFLVPTYPHALVVEESFAKWLTSFDKSNRFKFTPLAVEED